MYNVLADAKVPQLKPRDAFGYQGCDRWPSRICIKLLLYSRNTTRQYPLIPQVDEWNRSTPAVRPKGRAA